MDLEKSLQFDPLIHQIEKMSDLTKEMSFEDIIAGIAQQRDIIDTLTVSYDENATALAGQQSILDGLIAQRDALKQSYDIENAELDLLKAGYAEYEDKIKAIEDALKAVADAYTQVKRAGGGGAGSSAFDAAAAGDFADAMLAAASSDLNLDELLKQWREQAGKLFNFDLFGWIRKAFQKLSEWWTGTVVPWFQGIFGWIGNLFNGGGDIKLGFLEPIIKELAKFKEVIAPLLEAVKHVFNAIADVIGPALALIGVIMWPMLKALQAMWIIAWNVLKEVVVPIFQFISGIIVGALKVIRGVIMFFLNLINGDWGKAWNSIKDVFAGVWDILYQLVVGAGKILWGAIKGLIKGIIEVFDGIWDSMWEIGKNIIGGLVDGLEKAASAVWNFVTWLPRKFFSIIKSLFGINSPSTEMALIGVNIVLGMLNGLKNTIEKVWDWATSIPGKFLELCADAGRWLLDIGKKIMQGLWNGLKEIWEDVKGWFKDVTDWIPDLKGPPEKDAQLLVENGRLIMGGLYNGMQDGWGEISIWLSSLGDDIESTIQQIANSIQSSDWSTGAALITGMSDSFTSFDQAMSMTREEQIKLTQAILDGQTPVSQTIDANRKISGSYYEIGDQLFYVKRQMIDTIVQAAGMAEVLAGVDQQRSILRMGQDFDDTKERMMRAWAGMSDGSLSAEQASRDYQMAILDIKEDVIKYASEVAKLPQQQITQVVALIDQGKLDEAEALLKAFEEQKRTIFFDSEVRAPHAGSGLRYLAAGGIISRPTFAMVGEAGPEMVLPLNDARRAMELIRQAGVTRWFTTGSNAAGTVAAGRGATVAGGGTVNSKQIVFTGDLSFPNITSGDDADKFISNLEALAG